VQELISNIFNIWQEDGSTLISDSFAEFRSLVAVAAEFARRGNYQVAAVYAEMAAAHAANQHCGLFASPELERLLMLIAQKTIDSNHQIANQQFSNRSPRQILHVASSVMGIGGHSRMLWRWIAQDSQSCHSLALTRQFPAAVPQVLADAIGNSGGKIHTINKNFGGLIAWARQLRSIAATADLVVLHVANHDVVPFLAFANKQQSPPTLFVDHADHQFWIGASTSDVVVSLRESGMRLAIERRAIPAHRSMLLPIIIEPTQRQVDRAAAKQQIGIPADSVMLLSIARSVKYQTIDGMSFADAHLPLLQKFDRAVLVVVGPDPAQCQDWAAAISQAQGRIEIVPAREDTAIFYQAADIYVDSFPFISNTSLLEAGTYGVPLVSRYPYPSDSSDILGADMPGLTGNLIRVRDLDEYTKMLSQLVENAAFRQSLGEATRQKIIDVHTGTNWQQSLQAIYSQAAQLDRVPTPSSASDRLFIGEPDVFLPYVHGFNKDDRMHQKYLRIMPTWQRVRDWIGFVKKQGIQENPVHFLVPELFRAWYHALRAQLKLHGSNSTSNY
jgi:glycosyltransferase involved in cell wall biosynthesis